MRQYGLIKEMPGNDTRLASYVAKQNKHSDFLEVKYENCIDDFAVCENQRKTKKDIVYWCVLINLTYLCNYTYIGNLFLGPDFALIMAVLPLIHTYEWQNLAFGT